MNHFKGKAALGHIVEKKIQGIFNRIEPHGLETPGHKAAFLDAFKETALFILLLLVILAPTNTSLSSHLAFLASLAGFTLWKTGRSAYLGWSRLEKLHRLIEQEKYEIEHHQDQEREEVVALYAAKGFSGKLLEDVVDVLMADPDRLLLLMLEEELGLQLAAYEHPLKQALGALLGSGIVSLFSLAMLLLLPPFYTQLSLGVLLLLCACYGALLEKNKVISAAIWTLALVALSLGATYFLLQLFALF